MEQSATQPHRAFAVDVKAIRAKVRRDIESGAVTEDTAPIARPCCACSTKPWPPKWSVGCATSATPSWRAASAEPVAAEFAEHAAEEQGHADRLAERIVQLGGEPDLRRSACSNAATPNMWKARISRT